MPASGAETHFVSEGDSVYSPLIGSVAVNGGPTELWYLFDALGTTIGLSDADGALTDTRLYDAFGNILGSTGTTTTPFEYVGAYGYYQEPEIDQMLLWHRWYGAGVGKFGSRDAGEDQVHPYAYVDGEPSDAIDADGGLRWPSRWWPPKWWPWKPKPRSPKEKLEDIIRIIVTGGMTQVKGSEVIGILQCLGPFASMYLKVAIKNAIVELGNMLDEKKIGQDEYKRRLALLERLQAIVNGVDMSNPFPFD